MIIAYVPPSIIGKTNASVYHRFYKMWSPVTKGEVTKYVQGKRPKDEADGEFDEVEDEEPGDVGDQVDPGEGNGDGTGIPLPAEAQGYEFMQRMPSNDLLLLLPGMQPNAQQAAIVVLRSRGVNPPPPTQPATAPAGPSAPTGPGGTPPVRDAQPQLRSAAW